MCFVNDVYDVAALSRLYDACVPIQAVSSGVSDMICEADVSMADLAVCASLISCSASDAMSMVRH